MKFRTELTFKKADRKIDYSSRILLLGSCFSDHISTKLEHAGFSVRTNPHGILFHPGAIEASVRECLLERQYAIGDLLHNGENWVSLNHHGKFNHPDAEVVLERINSNLRDTGIFLKEATHLFITLGTAWVYRHRAQDRLVANCHRIPQKEFSKELLTPGEILLSLQGLIDRVRAANSSVEFVFTVSPVRHLKDGIVENTLSKARLHQAVHELIGQKGVHYFPAYEIMMDDLRDYRFYERDLIHPNAVAVDYIWEKFTGVWTDPKVGGLMKKVEEIHKALQHRLLSPDTPKSREFREKIEKEIEELQRNHPEIRLVQ